MPYHVPSSSYDAWLDDLCRDRHGTSYHALEARNAELEKRNRELKDQHREDREIINRLEQRVRGLVDRIKIVEDWYMITREKLKQERMWR